MVIFGKSADKLTAPHSIYVIYYLTCKMCNEKEIHIGKALGNYMQGFKVRKNQYISSCKTVVSTCKFLRLKINV